MSLSMAQQILEPLLLSSEGYLDIAFVGGETLLAMPVIIQIVEWAKQGQWNCKYRFLGTTNGTLLTSDYKEWLTRNKEYIILALSYDGVPSMQEQNRTKLDIDIDFFIKTWPQQPLQMTINRASIKNMAEGVIYLLEKGAKVHPNVAFEKEEWTIQEVGEYGKQLDILAQYFDKHENLPTIIQFEHNLNAYSDSIDNHQPQSQVCGAGHGYRVFDVDGKSYPCHILSPLVLNDDSLTQIDEGQIESTKDFADPKCADCPYTSNCPTCIGCNLLYRHNLVKRDKTHCWIMRTEVRCFLKKEVNRLKKKKQLNPKDAREIDSIRKLYEYEKNHNFNM